MNKKTKKRTLSMALAAALAFSPVQALAASSDLAGHWAEDVITQWENAGMISGYEDGTFKPNNSVTRAEFVIMMNNALGLTEAGEVSFSDVQPGNWFYNAVAIAVAAGYCSGYEDGTFKPSATITRAEAAVMIANAAGLEQDATGAAGFTDSIPAWAQGSVGAVVNAGFMSGYPDGTFAANQSITRAEAVSSLNRVIGGVTANDVVVTEATEIADQTIEGNLIIDAALTDGTVTVKNTTVTGNIVVRGGAAEALKLDGVTLKGKLIVEKEGAEVVLTGETKVPSVEISALSTLSEDNFKGSVGTITITKNLDTAKTVKLSVPADKVVLDGTAAVDVNEDVTAVEVTKNAEGSKVYVNSGVTVDTVIADAKATVSGSGTVKVLEANASGITLGSNLKVNKTEVAEGVEKPTTSTSGGGGGGGGSSTTDDDDDIPTPQYEVTDTTTWAEVVKAVNGAKSTNYKVVVKDTTSLGTITNDEASTLKFSGNGTLTIDFQNTTVAAGNMKIEAPNAARIELVDDATGTNGVQLTSLTINAPKATVNDNFVATTRNIKEVSDATFNVKDNHNTTTVNIEKGTVNVASVSGTVNVNVNGAGPVTVKGTVDDVDVITGGENAEVNIAGTVTGDVNSTGTAAKINVVDGANITNLETKAKATYNVKGGKVDTLNLTTAPQAATATGGTIDTLTLATNSLTVAGATVGTATVSTGTLTVNSGSVAKATVTGAGTVDGTGKVGTVDVTATNATVGVETVDTIKLGTGATSVTVNSKTVGTIEAGATSGQITLANDAKVNTLIATEDTTLATADGKIGTVVAVTNTVTVKDEKQVGSVKLSNGGTVEVQGSGEISGVEKTEIGKVTLKSAPNKTVYEKDEALDLSGLVLTVNQTVTDKDGNVGQATDTTVNYSDAGVPALVTVDGTFSTASVIKDQKVGLKYAGVAVEDANGAYQYTYSVVPNQNAWKDAAKTALDTGVGTALDKAIAVSTVQTPGTGTKLPGQVTVESETINVTWQNGNTSYVTLGQYGNDQEAFVLNAERDKQVPVTLTATVTSAEYGYTISVPYTLTVAAINQGAMDAWTTIESQVTTAAQNPILVKDVPTTEEAAKTEILKALASATASGYTLDVTSAVNAGNTWKATLTLTNDSVADDYVTKEVTFTIVDQAAGAKAELSKLTALTTLSLPSGTMKGGETAVTTAIQNAAQAKVSDGYQVTAKVEADGYVVADDQKSATWKGTFTVAGSGSDTATSDVVTIIVSEGQDITLGAATITGNTDKLDGTPEVKLTAGNATFDTTKVKAKADVTEWFTNLPTGLVATVKEVGADAKSVTVSFAWSEDPSVAHGTTKDAEKLKVSVTSEYFTDAKATLTTEGPATIQIAQAQGNVEVPNVTVKIGNDRVSITLSEESGATFNDTSGSPATNIANYTFNNKAFEGTATVSDDKKTVTIKLDKELEADTTYTIGINAAVFAEGAVVEPNDVTVKYYTAQKDVAKTGLPLRDGATALFVKLPEGKEFAEGIESKAASFTLTPDSGVTINSVAFVGEAKNEVKLTFAAPVSGQNDNVTLTIKADALADPENVVTAADVTAESRILLTKDAITKVNLVDKSEAAFSPVCGDNTATLDELKEGVLNQVTVTTTKLRYHKNGNGDFGYWSGFGVEAPEGATGMKYQFATTEAGLETLNDSPALDVAIDGTPGKNGIAFFIDAFPANDDEVTKFVAVQFYDASGVMTPVYKFEMNLDAVAKANQGVTVAAKADQDYVIADGTITGGETDKITTATTVQDFKDTLKASDSADTDNNVSTGATIKVVDAEIAEGITTAVQFHNAVEKADNMEDGVVVVVLSEDLSKIGRYTVNVEAGA